jgi:hypothetical protein
MFDPSAVKSKATIVPDRNGMYTFRGTYDGPVEFFAGQPIRESAIWTSEADVVEVLNVETHSDVSPDVVEGWNQTDRPVAFDMAARPDRDEF